MEKLSPQQIADRAREKQESRERDAHSLSAGEKNAESLRLENGLFAFPGAQIDLASATLY